MPIATVTTCFATATNLKIYQRKPVKM